MSHDLTTFLALLAGYLVVAGVLLLWLWRASRRIPSIGLRLAVRACAIAFLLAPGAACVGGTLAPFFLGVVAEVAGLILPDVCAPYAPRNLVSFVLTFAIVAIALYVLDRLRHPGSESPEVSRSDDQDR